MAVLETGTFLVGDKPSPQEWGMAWLRIGTFVQDKINSLKPKPIILGFESPFVPPPQKAPQPGRKTFAVNWENLRFLFGVVTVFEMCAIRNGLQPLEVNVQTVKASLAGEAKKIARDAELDRLREIGVDKKTINKRRFELLKISKEEMENAAKARGWKVADHHQADACGVGKVIIENRWAEGESRNVATSSGASSRRR